MTDDFPQEPVTVTDKRRIDPETGEVRHDSPGASAPGEPARPAGAPDPSSNKVAELTADLQRVQADFANYRKRAMRDQQAAADRARAAVVGELLHAVDDIERARKHGDLESGPLKAVADKLMNVLNGLGLKAFGEEGEDLDPVLHEAVQHEGNGGQDAKPVIGTVMRQGYQLGEHVLRNALVAVVETVPDGPADENAAGAKETGPGDTGDNTDRSGD